MQEASTLQDSWINGAPKNVFYNYINSQDRHPTKALGLKIYSNYTFQQGVLGMYIDIW